MKPISGFDSVNNAQQVVEGNFNQRGEGGEGGVLAIELDRTHADVSVDGIGATLVNPKYAALIDQCKSALSDLEQCVEDLLDATQLCDTNWSPTLIEHVPQVYALQKTELGFKLGAFDRLKDAAAFGTDDDEANIRYLANWICTRPSDMLAPIMDMLAVKHELNLDEAPPCD